MPILLIILLVALLPFSAYAAYSLLTDKTKGEMIGLPGWDEEKFK